MKTFHSAAIATGLVFAIFISVVFCENVEKCFTSNCEQCVAEEGCFYAKIKPGNILKCLPQKQFNPKFVRVSYRNYKECGRVNKIQADEKRKESVTGVPHQLPTTTPSVPTTILHAKKYFPGIPLENPKDLAIEQTTTASITKNIPVTNISAVDRLDDDLTIYSQTTPTATTNFQITEIATEATDATESSSNSVGQLGPLLSTFPETEATQFEPPSTLAPSKIPIPNPFVEPSVKFPIDYSLQERNKEQEISINCQGWNTKSHLIHLKLAACRLLNLSTRESFGSFKEYLQFALANPMAQKVHECILLNLQKKNC